MPGQTFTTYINAKRTGSVDAEFARLGQAAGKPLTDITKKANEASRALAGLTGGRGTAGRSPITQAYLSGFDQAKQKADRLSESQARLARENSSLVRALRTTGNTLQVVQGPLGPIAGRVTAAADALVRLTGVTLGLAGAGAALFAYVRAANQFVEVRSKLATLYDSQTDVNSAMEDIYGIAQRARAGLEPVADLYAKLKLNADQFGFSQQRVNRLTELASKAATLSGGSAQSREAGLYQFAQAVGSNQLGGDELRSVKENIPALARELALGLNKLTEFKGQQISIGNLKKLATEGKLTADVIARAMEAAAGDIEARYAKMPMTLGQASTSLGNSATMFIGRFEEATGIVANLASGIQLLGNNLNVVVGLAGGVAAGFGAIIAAGKFKSIAADVNAWATNIKAQQSAARVSLALAIDAQKVTRQQTIAYNQEANQIQRNIVLLEQELRVQQQLATQGAISARAGLPGGAQMAAAGSAGAKRATKELADEVERLSVVQTQAVTAGRRLEGQNKAIDIATKTVSKSTGIFKSGLMALLGSLNPVGIAVGLATTAFLEWAMSESAAEKAARKVEDAQRALATVIDFTTGKVREQNNVLLANAKLAAGQGIGAANAAHLAARQQLLNLRGQVAGQTVTPEGQVVQLGQSAGQKAFEQALNRFQAGGSVQELQRVAETLAKQDPKLRALSDQVTVLAGDAQKAAREVGSLQSSLKIIGGTASAEDIRRAQGDYSGGLAQGETKSRNLIAEAEELRKKLRDQRFAAETQMNESLANLEKRRSQLTADDYVRERAQIEATYDTAIKNLDKQDAAAAKRAEREEERKRKAHERELARIELENKRREQRTDKRLDIVGRYSNEPTPIVKATRDVRELNEMIGKTMNGLQAITTDNPLGQGIYTREMAAIDAQNIQDGLQKPFTEYLRERERDVQISQLLLEGHDLEAQALQKAFDLYGSIGAVTMDQYHIVLQNLEAEERMNDALAQRERIMAPLKAAADNVRGSIVSAIEAIEAGTNPLKAGKNFFKSLLSQFNQATAIQLTEKITGGLDQRVRDLMRGSVNVDTKIADYLQALNGTADGAMTLGKSLNTTAEAARNATAALNGIVGSPGKIAEPVSAGASVAAAGSSIYSMLGAKLPSSFYKQGVNVGSGVGDNIIFKAIGSLGAVITENLRSQATQNSLYARGLTPAKVSDHTTTQEAYDVRLPAGMSYSTATTLIKKQASEFGYQVVKAINETQTGGTGPHGHYVFAKGSGVAAGQATQAAAGPIGGTAVATQAFLQDMTQFLASTGGTSQTKQAGASVPLVGPNGEITITGSRLSKGGSIGRSLFGGQTEKVYNEVGKAVGDNLDKALGTKFLGNLGSKLGTALQGAQTGALTNSILKPLGKMLGFKTSAAGAEIGGAIGSFLPFPGGDIVGSIAGSLIGGLMKKTKKASSTITGSGGSIDVGKAVGNNAQAISASTEAATSVSDALQQIADQLGVTIGNFSVSIGTRHGDYRVDPSGQGKTKISSGAIDFNDDQAGAIRYALMDAIKDGALQGLSAASQVILRKAKDLNTALNKVMVIESIPKRLMALKDPVRAAVMSLNDEFAKMISYLKEGGATIEQFKQAQELYDLERQKAVAEAANNSISQIQDYIDEMLGGSSSPLNKQTVYENAQATLNPLASDVQAGKVVDADALLKAVQNFQNASQELNGSSQSFFTDFDYLLGLLNKAKSNVVGSTATYDTSTLPPSPFDDASVQAIINGTSGTINAINTQTGVLTDELRAIRDALSGGGGSAIDYLPTGGGGGGGTTWLRYQLA